MKRLKPISATEIPESAGEPVMASIGMIIRKRPMNIAMPSVLFQNGTLADRPANALPLLPVCEL